MRRRGRRLLPAQAKEAYNDNRNPRSPSPQPRQARSATRASLLVRGGHNSQRGPSMAIGAAFIRAVQGMSPTSTQGRLGASSSDGPAHLVATTIEPPSRTAAFRGKRGRQARQESVVAVDLAPGASPTCSFEIGRCCSMVMTQTAGHGKLGSQRTLLLGSVLLRPSREPRAL